MSIVKAAFFLFWLSLSLHACNGRILSGMEFDHVRGADSKSVTVSIDSNLRECDAALSMKTTSTMIKEQAVRDRRSYTNDDKETLNTEERMLQEKNAAVQEYESKDSNDVAEDVVVMDYAQPHRKPPIHNEEN